MASDYGVKNRPGNLKNSGPILSEKSSKIDAFSDIVKKFTI